MTHPISQREARPLTQRQLEVLLALYRIKVILAQQVLRMGGGRQPKREQAKERS